MRNKCLYGSWLQCLVAVTTAVVSHASHFGVFFLSFSVPSQGDKQDVQPSLTGDSCIHHTRLVIVWDGMQQSIINNAITNDKGISTSTLKTERNILNCELRLVDRWYFNYENTLIQLRLSYAALISISIVK